MVVALTAPRPGICVCCLTPGVVGGQSRAGRSELVHQAVHHLAEGVVDRSAGAGVEVATDDDEISAVAPREIVSSFRFKDNE